MQRRAFSWIRGRRYPDVPGLANEVCAKTLGRSLRITVEILFGSLAADNKVPPRDPPSSPPKSVPYPLTDIHTHIHTYTRASPSALSARLGHGRASWAELIPRCSPRLETGFPEPLRGTYYHLPISQPPRTDACVSLWVVFVCCRLAMIALMLSLFL